MANLDNALQQLREEREQAQSQVEKLDSAISVLQGIVGTNSSRVTRNGSQPKRVVTAASRRKMAQAQRARWAKLRQSHSAGAGKTLSIGTAKRTLSAAARRKIAAAQRARWARVKAQQAKKAA
jgi:hypothetical protein